jgi:hypothetical protein
VILADVSDGAVSGSPSGGGAIGVAHGLVSVEARCDRRRRGIYGWAQLEAAG